MIRSKWQQSDVKNIARSIAFDVKTIVQNTKLESNLDELSSNLNKIKPVPRRTTKQIIGKPSWNSLNELLNPNYTPPTAAALNNSNHFFNSANIKFEWSVSNFKDIPGEKLKEKYESLKRTQLLSSSSTKKFPGKTYVPFELVNGLPEVTFLGKSNAGKSTLLNNLTTDLKVSSLSSFAKASRKAGFTKTLNSFNISNKIRLIDSPGYGFKSKLEQGDLTMQFLLNRKELLRTFLLISGEQGVSDLDLQIIEFMHENGVPFEIVFTKMDKVKNLERFQAQIRESGILSLPALPRLIFTNSLTSKLCSKRYGIDILRFVILQSCGLQSAPSKKEKK